MQVKGKKLRTNLQKGRGVDWGRGAEVWVKHKCSPGACSHKAALRHLSTDGEEQLDKQV